MKKGAAKQMAFGGVFAALAVVIMSLGTLIPIATFVCPVICMVILSFVLRMCGRKTGWVWYIAVSILSLLLSPDKEAAAVFAFLGFYPILKPGMDKLTGSFFWKLVFFNADIGLLYWILLRFIGMEHLVAEYSGMGLAMTAALLILGNLVFFLLDKVLARFQNYR